MSNTITLYDLDNRAQPHTGWSYNAWKIRLVLNFKHIPYTTTWVDHASLGPTLAALGVPRREQGIPYTVPTIKSTDGTMITESAVIAAKLEELSPSPSLHLDTELQVEADKIAQSIAMPLMPSFMARTAREIVPTAGLEAFRTSREKRFGMTLEQMETARLVDAVWASAEPGLQALRAILTEHKVDQGPFIKGKDVCYADFVLLAMFEAMKRMGQDIHDRLVSRDVVFQQFYDAGKQWTERDN